MDVLYLPSLRSYLALSKGEARQLDATVSMAKSCFVLHDRQYMDISHIRSRRVVRKKRKGRNLSYNRALSVGSSHRRAFDRIKPLDTLRSGRVFYRRLFPLLRNRCCGGISLHILQQYHDSTATTYSLYLPKTEISTLSRSPHFNE